MIKQIEKDMGWKKIKEEHRLKNVEIDVGLFGSGIPENNPAYLGLIQNYGAKIKITPKMRAFLRYIGLFVKKDTLYIVIPKRAFMEKAFDKGYKELVKFIVYEYGKVLDGKQTFKKMIDRIGVYHEGQIKDAFTKFKYDKLHPLTVARKGSSKPLIGRGGQLRSNVKYKVITK